ncbi:YkoF family thiamine/hydroxymethylpyrimidine-binding protein [Alteromonas facilis]|uniref:YkoF family thiamine/hydroxymethylpyrimidine-binding protein n=1 Tax=Alteromonas facilis TaxID=2048004 RepID=UPI000C283F0E|nr:YkoF family thiamine/hydroxymethylpyrimidine-binding protein [Alteromonas facilis]
MKLCTVEISLYPLMDGYVDVIKTFIGRLQNHSTLELSTSTTSTQVRGDYRTVFEVLSHEIEAIHNEVGQAIFVCKFLAGDDVKPGLYHES